MQRFDLVFECRAERMWREPVTGGPLWWSLNEIASLCDAADSRRAIIVEVDHASGPTPEGGPLGLCRRGLSGGSEDGALLHSLQAE